MSRGDDSVPGIIQMQEAFCLERGAKFLPTFPMSKLGFALSTEGQLPINGLRHPVEGNASGWYIWCGEALSSAPNFFAPAHQPPL